MKLLITNDDGVFAPGIVELASALGRSGHECAVTAPDRERSSVGHSITLTRPLRLWEAPPGPYPPNAEYLHATEPRRTVLYWPWRR